MRKRFALELELGQVPIEEVKIPINSRDELPPILIGLQWIFKNPEVRDQILDLVEDKVLKGKKETGRTGMGLWQILVLGVVRLGLDCDYDRLEYVAHYDMLLRKIMGVGPSITNEEEFGKIFHQKTICDNVKYIDEEMLREINKIVEKAGSELILKKNEEVELKTDSYALETNVHFPTDYNLLWDAIRKCIELCVKLSKGHKVKGWRKFREWLKQLKGLMRVCGRINRAGGKNKEDRLKNKVKEYLSLAKYLEEKVSKTITEMIEKSKNSVNEKVLGELIYFHDMMLKHIDLIERRVLKEETIAHEEKIFSLFEAHTQWINKGKFNNPIELGHKILLTTNQHGMIVDYKVMEQNIDSKEVNDLKSRLTSIYNENKVTISFDKGFSSKENRELFESGNFEVIMPKKGRLSKEDKDRESTRKFKHLKNRHSAVESNINCLEHHGLNRCPDKGLASFLRYVGIGILAYNLHKIGNCIIRNSRLEKYEQSYQQAA